jgi:hypothetical protein
LRRGIWPYRWSLAEVDMAVGENDDDDDVAVVEQVAGPIT